MAFSFVQSKSAGGTGAAPAATFTTAPTANNLLVAAVNSAGATAITMTSTGWTALTSIAGGSGGTQFANRMFWKMALAGESSTVTAAAASNAWTITVAEYSCLNQAVAVAKESAQANASGTAQPTPSVTPVCGDEILVVCSAGVRIASSSFSGETIGGSATGVTEREDVNQATNACNGALYDAIYSFTDNGYSGAATSSGTAVGGGNIIIFTQNEPVFNNYGAIVAADNGNGVMSVTEKIR